MIAPSSIEKLYTAFRDVPAPRNIEHCPCCMKAEEIATLLSTPLRKIPKDLMGKYGGNAFHTIGDAEEYHYFFPRLLELVATDIGFWPDWELLLAKLNLASWDTWNAEQKDSIMSIVDSRFDSFVDEPDPELLNVTDIEGMLNGMANSGLMLEPYLKKLSASQYKNEFDNFVAEILDLRPAGH